MEELSSFQKYTGMSQRFIQQAGDEFQRGDLLQASEKAWGAAALATKSIAEQRAWRHNGHDLLYAISAQIADELGRPDLRRLFRSASSLHTNFYENWMGETHVQDGIDDAKTYVQEIEVIQASPRPPYTPQTREQIARLRRLTAS